jgi:hypothetical protein
VPRGLWKNAPHKACTTISEHEQGLFRDGFDGPQFSLLLGPRFNADVTHLEKLPIVRVRQFLVLWLKKIPCPSRRFGALLPRISCEEIQEGYNR